MKKFIQKYIRSTATIPSDWEIEPTDILFSIVVSPIALPLFTLSYFLNKD